MKDALTVKNTKIKIQFYVTGTSKTLTVSLATADEKIGGAVVLRTALGGRRFPRNRLPS